MPLKPIFDKAPLTAMTSHPLRAGLVRSESAAMAKLYTLTASANEPAALEGTFRLACIVTGKPADEPVAARIRAVLSTQKDDGSFALSFKDSVALLRAAWALYEYEARKPLLDHIARWCAFAVTAWDALLQDDDIRVYSADLLELLENLYRVTGKAAVLTLCQRLAEESMGWSSILNTLSNQRPTSKTITPEELLAGIAKEQNGEEGYYTRLYYANHAESLADGARSTMAKGWYSGSATELNATRNGWERLYRHHGAICGGLTCDEMLEGTSPAALISTAALGAWAEAIASAAMTDDSGWAYDALERMFYNAMPCCLQTQQVMPYQQVNTLNAAQPATPIFPSDDHAARAGIRLVRGYAAVASTAVTARVDGASINLYIPGRYAVPVNEDLLLLDVSASVTGANLTLHTKKEIRTTLRMRMPKWSRHAEVSINGTEYHGDVKNDMLSIDRTWHEGDTIVLHFEQSLTILDGHHQGKYVLRGPVVMALSAEEAWQMAFVSAATENNCVTARMEKVPSWKAKGHVPADIPVLPETDGDVSVCSLAPYARLNARIALFPGRKQA